MIQKTGIYLDPLEELKRAAVNIDPATYTRFLPGVILTDDDRPQNISGAPKIRRKKAQSEFADKKNSIRIHQDINIEKSGIPELKMTFIPFMSPSAAGKVGFNLAIFADEEPKALGRKILPLLQEVYIPVDFSRFLGLKVVQGRRKHSDEFALMIFVSEKDQASINASPLRGGSGVYVLNFRVNQHAAGPLIQLSLLNSDNNDGLWLALSQVSGEQIKNRVTYDADGHPLWIETPELDKTNKNYQIRYLNRNNDRSMYVNQGLSQVRVRWDEGLEDSWDLQYSRKSRWMVGYRSNLEQRINGLEKYLEEQKTLEETRAKKGKKAVNKRNEALFPDLNDYLEHLAAQDSPREHTVLLVEPGMLTNLRMLITSRLLEKPEQKHAWNLDNSKFGFYVYDPSFPMDETMNNLSMIGRGSNRDVLFVDLEVVKDLEAQDSPRSYNDADGDGSESQNQILPKLMRADTQDVDKNTSANASGDQQQNERKRSPDGAGNDESNERALRFAYARLAYLATEGDVVNLRRFEHSQPTNRIPTLILATPAMWREYKSRFPQEEKAGVFNHFKVDARFLTGPWTVWSPKSAQASAETLQYQQSAASKDEYMIFKNLDHILQAAASSKEPAKHQLLVVPEEIKPLITRLIMTRWATDMPELDGPWSFRNRELALFQLGAAGTQQDQIFDNYESMRGSLASRRPVLLADMSEILKAGRVSAANIDASFRVRDPLISAQPASSLLTEIDSQSKSKKVEADALQSNGEVDDNDADGEESAMRSQLPHMIWWLATEGKKIQPKKAKGWSLRAEVKPEIPTLILTTEKELETLAQDASFEARFMKIEDTFAVTRMERPSDQDKASFLEDLFRRPNIASLNYEFRHNDLPSDQARKQLIGLLIGQVEQIARQLKLEPTYAFLKIYIALNKALTEDVELRRSRYVDAPSLFRLFARVFPLPLTYEILRPEDPLQKLREADRASRGLEEAGYNGPMELKTRHVRNITSHTRAAGDSSRRIPSSQVLIGEPGTGKTFLLEVTARFLGLKLYDFNKPHEEDAGAMFLRVMDLVDEPDPAHPEKMDVKKAIEHMSNFLALPNGWRGMLVIDDLHKAGSAKILSQLMSFIQSLQEAPSGIYRARRMAVQGQTGEVKEIPVRNIMLNVTLNPTKDRDLRKRFLSEYGEKNPALEAVAALTRDGYTVEDSFFSRFTDIIDMSQFPREAKVPAILKNIREANATEYATRPRVVLVSPLTLNHLMDQFQAANARDLISPATFAMLNLTSNLRKAPLYLIDPQTKIGEAAAQDSTLADRKPVWNNWMSESKKVEPGQIEEALRSHTVVHAITQDDAVSKLQLLSFMADNFRGSLYFALILDAQNSPLLTHSYEARANNLFSFLAAVIGNVGQFRRLPLKEMNIKPQDLGVRDLDNITTLQTEIKKHASNASMPKIRIPVGVVLGAQVDLSSFLGNKERTFSERRRLDVMVETTAEVQTVVEKLLAKVYHVENLKDLTNPLNWINSLDETDPKAAFKEASGELFRIYLKFARSLYDMNLEEARNSEGLLQMQSYDEARLFLLCVDRALTQLPWSYLTQFTLSAAHLAASDLAIGQKIGLQHFLFKSNFSPLATVTPESILTNTRSISALKDLSTERENAYHTRFDTSCDRFLKTTAQ
ncbi:MAG: AAA family ATPase [Bdellovibrionales bacterium]